LLAPHLTSDNHAEVLAAARHRSKQGIQELIASLNPRPEAATIIRRVAAHPSKVNPVPVLAPAAELKTSLPMNTALTSSGRPSVAATPAPQFRAPVVTPLAPERYKLQVTLTRETHEKLRRAQSLSRHTLAAGDIGSILDRALTLLIDYLERRRFARVASPQPSRRENTPSGRHIPSAVRRAVWQRDEGRCGFVGRTGRCRETAFLEFHHVVPYAAGGAATADNIQLRCRAHNQYEARLFFGDTLVRERSWAWGEHTLSDGTIEDYRSSRQEWPFTQSLER
jgi:HNH endonuclease